MTTRPPPLEATILPDLPPPRDARGTWLLVGGALVLMVALLSAAIWGLGKLTTFQRVADPDSLVDRWETPAERAANIARAMNGDSVGCSAGELRDLGRLLVRLNNAGRNDDDEAFRACVDLDLMVRRIRQHPSLESGSGAWKLKTELAYLLETPEGYTDFSIVRVERGQRQDQALVYVVQSDYNQMAAFRYWLQRSGRNWKLFDYERLNRAHSHAADWAVRDAVAAHPDGYNYHKLDAIYGSETEAADPAKIAALAILPLPPAVHDLGRLDLAWALAWQDQYTAALDVCATISAEKQPGVHLVRADALHNLGRHGLALAAAQEYQRLLGRGPQALIIEAESLEAQQNAAGAAAKWRELLQLCPNYREGLRSYCLLADREGLAQLPKILERMPQPLDAAADEAQTALYRDDLATFETLQAFVEQQAPASPLLLTLQAARLENAQKYEQAAALYRQAAQLEWLPAKRAEYEIEYLRAMNAAGKAAEAYARAEDPAAAFEFLTSDYEEYEGGIADEQLPALLAAHRQRQPEGTQADYYEGQLLLRQQKYSQASAMLEAAVAQESDPDQKSLLQGLRTAALFHLGRGQEAYESRGRTPEVFQQLAQLCQQQGEWEQLRQLVERHRASNPDDPWIDYFLALDYQQQGDYPLALEALRRAEQSEDESLQMYCQWLKPGLLLKGGSLQEAYASDTDRAASFTRLAGTLSQQEDWQRLLALVELHAADSADSEAQSWKSLALWKTGKYDEVVASLTPWPDFPLTADAGTVNVLHERLVRSLIRLGQLVEARQLAERASRERYDDFPLLLVQLAEGNFAAAEERMADKAFAASVLERSLYDDGELRAILYEPQLAGLRQTLVLPLPNSSSESRGTLVLLLREGVTLTAEELTERLRTLGVTENVQTVAAGHEGGPASYVLQQPDQALVLTIGQVPYGARDELDQAHLPDAELQRQLKEHRAFIAIDFERSDQARASREFEVLASLLAADLCEPAAVAVYGSRGWRERRFARAGVETIRALRRGTWMRQEQGSTPAIYLSDPNDAEASAPAAAEATAARHEAVGCIVRQMREEPESAAHEVCVELSRGHARERVWLHVVGARPSGYSWELVGQLQADSALWPQLRAGDRLATGFYRVVELRAASAAGSADK
ncbi:MAG: hypothetical protein WD872_00670 [Pirellulaceae bacterium]